jgi:hypothetical protein
MGPPPCLVHPATQPGLCQICAKRAAFTRARSRALIVTAGALAVTAAIVTFLSTRPSKPPPPPPKAEVDMLEKYKRERLAAKPCGEEASIDLVEHLMIERRWQDALDAALASLKSCGELGNMKLRLLQCRQQLHQWSEAALLIDDMIAEAPRDASAWWLHGETWRYRNQNELAMIDFRQSLANAYWSRSAIAVRLFMYAAEPAKVPCEAYRAWRYHQQELGGRIDDEARNLVAALDRAKTCVPERGTGRARLAFDKRIRATIGNTTAELMVDPRAGTTIISREVAERAGIAPTATGHTPTLWQEVRISAQPARVAKLSIGGATAANVELAISDDLAVGDDGVVGLSFLWHFDMSREEHAVILAPPR